MQAVRREGKRIRTEHLDVRVSASLLLHPRVGLVVPKQKHSAVERNRLKRRLRELVRTRLLATLPPVDVVIRTLPEAYDAGFASLERQLTKVAERVRTALPQTRGGDAPLLPPSSGATRRRGGE